MGMVVERLKCRRADTTPQTLTKRLVCLLAAALAAMLWITPVGLADEEGDDAAVEDSGMLSSSITDTENLLGSNVGAVNDAIDQLHEDSGVSVRLLYLTSFSAGEDDVDQWASDVLESTEPGPNTVLLAVASHDGNLVVAVSSNSDEWLRRQQTVDELSQAALDPLVENDTPDWSGSAIAMVERIGDIHRQEQARLPILIGSVAAGVVVIAALAAVVVLVVRRRRRNVPDEPTEEAEEADATDTAAQPDSDTMDSDTSESDSDITDSDTSQSDSDTLASVEPTGDTAYSVEDGIDWGMAVTSVEDGVESQEDAARAENAEADDADGAMTFPSPTESDEPLDEAEPVEAVPSSPDAWPEDAELGIAGLEPVVLEPVVLEMTETEPVETEPVGTEPAETEPVEVGTELEEESVEPEVAAETEAEPATGPESAENAAADAGAKKPRRRGLLLLRRKPRGRHSA